MFSVEQWAGSSLASSVLGDRCRGRERGGVEGREGGAGVGGQWMEGRGVGREWGSGVVHEVKLLEYQ